MLIVGVTAGLASAYTSGAFQASVDATYLGRMGSMIALTDDALMPVMMVAFAAFAGAASLTLASVTLSVMFAALVIWSAGRPYIDFAAEQREAELRTV